MARYALRELLVASEVSFASNANDPSTNTWDQRLPAENIILTLPHVRIEDVAHQSRQNVSGLSHKGAQDGSATLTFTTNLIGNNGTDPGSSTVTESFQTTLLGYAMGGKRVAGSGSTISGTSSTASSIYVASAAGWVAGDMAAIGAKGDGRGDGQVVVVSAVTAGSGLLDLLTNAPAAPTTAGETVSRLALIYPDETATLTTVRFAGMFEDTGAQFHMMGCQLQSVQFVTPLDGSGLGKINWTYRVAVWRNQATTFPGSLSMESNNGFAAGGGRFFLQDFGTKTHATEQPAVFEFTIDRGLEPQFGPGGLVSDQVVRAWTRMMDKPRARFVIPWENTYSTWWATNNASFTYKHLLMSLGCVGGYQVAVYLPRIQPVGDRPIVPDDQNGQCYVNINILGTESTDTTSALTRSAWRIGAG